MRRQVLHPILDLNSNRRSIKDNASDGRLAARLAALIDLHADDFDKSCLSQVHQYFISTAAATSAAAAAASSSPPSPSSSASHSAALSSADVGSSSSELSAVVSSSAQHRELAPLEQRCLDAFRQGTIDVSGSSGQQAEVGRALDALGIEAVSEFVDPRTGYSYDFWIPADGIALEFDGRSLGRALRWGGG